MDSFEKLNSENSFEELYDAYYFLQIKQQEIPMIKTFSKLKKGIISKLQNTLSEGKENFRKIHPFYNEEINLPQIISKGKEAEIEEEEISNMENQIKDKESQIKKLIKEKIQKHIESKNFQINMKLSYFENARNFTKNLKEGYSNLENQILLSFYNLDSSNILGLYYIFHEDIPKTEFFNKKFGFPLKISTFPEVEKAINEIRKKYGIKTPRALEKTLEQEGRIENDKKLETKLAYAIRGEREIYLYLEKYLKLNYGMPFFVEQCLGLFEKETKNLPIFYFGKFEYNKHKKYIWEGVLNVLKKEPSLQENRTELKDIYDKKIFGNSSYLSQEEIEEVSAYCIQKFMDMNVTNKLKIDFSKEYL